MTQCRQRRLAALFLVILSLAAGCVPTAEGTRDEQKNPFYLKGKERLQAMDYQGAVEAFERALMDNPKSVLAHFELGVVHEVHLGDYATALYHYNKALKLRPAGYPADNIRQRVPACRQELIKADSLAVVNPTALRETEKLREENQDLRRQLTELKAALAAQTGGVSPPGVVWGGGAATSAVPVTPGVGVGAATGNRTGMSGGGPVTVGTKPAGGVTGPGTAPGPGVTGTTGTTGSPSSAAGAGGKTHVVRPGDTFASIARTHGIRLETLVAANRGVDPKRIKIGQVLRIPSTSGGAPSGGAR